MKKLLSYLFPVPYPVAIIPHAIYGGIVGCLLAQLFGGSGVGGTAWGCGVGVVLGFLIWLRFRKRPGYIE